MNSAPREWYRVSNKAEEPTVADIEIFDFIGDWIDYYWGFGATAKQFLDQLAALPDAITTIHIRVNSPGGDVYSANAIANLLREQQASKGRTVKVSIVGLAASAATIITSAGTRGQVSIADNGQMYVHNPWTVSVGNASQLRKAAEDMDKVANGIIVAYRWRSELSEEELRELMDAETLMDADEAIAWGFADTKIEGLPAMAAAFDPRGRATVAAMPEPLRVKIEALMEPPKSEPVPDQVVPVAPAPADAQAILAACKAGHCLDLAEELVAARATPEQAAARIAEATEIRGLCAAAKLPELADGYLAARVPPATVKAQLTTITAKMDAVEIVTALPADGGSAPRAKTGPTTAEVYRLRAEAAAHARNGQRGA
jgi:ATP-dependent protease ClpP protease subunit